MDTQKILTIEEELELMEIQSLEEKGSRKRFKPKEPVDPELMKVRKTTTTRNEDKPVIDKLGRSVREKLEYYLKQNPKYNILIEQMEALKEEESNYRRNKEDQFAANCREMIKEIKSKITQIRKIFRGQTSTEISKEKEITKELIKNSQVIKDLNVQKEEIQLRIKLNTPSYWGTKVKDFRDQIEIQNTSKNNNDIPDIETLLDAPKMLDSISKQSKVEIEYANLLGEIADMLDLLPEEVNMMKIGTIQGKLAEVLEDPNEIREELDIVTAKINQEKANLGGAKTITNFIHEMIDFEEINEEDAMRAKEILALTHIPLVRKIAYNVCADINALSKLDDAVSYGLMGLTIAINKWLSIQIAAHEYAVSFAGFAPMYVNMMIKRGLFDLSAKGGASGSTVATAHHKNKKRLENFMKYNPEFKDVSIDLIQNLVDSSIDETKMIKIVDESDLMGDDDEGNNQAWSNATVDDVDLEIITQSKLEYERLIKSIKMLLDLFDDGTSTDGITHRKKKMFNKYDRKLFMMHFGLEYKKDKITPDNSTKANSYYTQEEMANELSAMYRADGDMKNANYRQENLAGKNGRIAKLERKIIAVVNANPQLKTAFEYLYRYWMENNNQLEMFSNAREEADMKIEREELRDIYAGNDNIMNKQLTDGKKLSDILELSNETLVDESLAKILNEYK